MADLRGDFLNSGTTPREILTARKDTLRKKQIAESAEKGKEKEELAKKNAYLNFSRNLDEKEAIEKEHSKSSKSSKSSQRKTSSKRDYVAVLVEEEEEDDDEEPLKRKRTSCGDTTVNKSATVQEPPRVEGAFLLRDVAEEECGASQGSHRGLSMAYPKKLPSFKALSQKDKEKHVMEIVKDWVPQDDVMEMVQTPKSLYPTLAASMMQTWIIGYSLSQAIKTSEEKAGHLKAALKKARLNLNTEEEKNKTLAQEVETKAKLCEQAFVEAKEAREALAAEKAKTVALGEENTALRTDVEYWKKRADMLFSMAKEQSTKAVEDMKKLMTDVDQFARATHQHFYPESDKVEEFSDVFNQLVEQKLILQDGKIIKADDMEDLENPNSSPKIVEGSRPIAAEGSSTMPPDPLDKGKQVALPAKEKNIQARDINLIEGQGSSDEFGSSPSGVGILNSDVESLLGSDEE